MASSEEFAGAAFSPSSASGAARGVQEVEERSMPTTTGIARREGLRGLGEELIRLDVRYLSGRPSPNIYICSWSYLLTVIVSVADSGLHDVLHPYIDPLLLERHGEQLLDFVIRLASKQHWKHWLGTLMKVAVSTSAVDVFLRLFAAHEDPVNNRTLRPLLNVVGAGTSVEMLSALVAAGAGQKEPSVSATDIAHRGELRGLAGELVRSDMRHQSGQGGSTIYRYSWLTIVADIAFTAGGASCLQPHDQNALLGSLGEQYFDIVIRLASKEEWKSWLEISARIAVSTAASDVLLRLLAAYDDPVGDDTLARLLSAATREGIVEVLPALIAAGAGPKECSMSNADIARREGLRGLGEELIRLDERGRSDRVRLIGYRYAWSPVVANIVFVADSKLHDVLRPYDDAALIESHGEQLLDFVIRLASKEQWKAWLDISASVAVKVEATSVLRRLFVAYEDSVDDKTLTKLFHIHWRGGSVDTLSALIDAGAKVREVDNVGWPGVAFHVTASAGHRTLVAKLIEMRAPFDSKQLLLTALRRAVEGGHKGVVLELLAAGADVNICTRRGDSFGMLTPLGVAVSKNDEGMVKVLLEAGAEPTTGPGDGIPLHVAVNRGLLDITHRLLLAGASVTSVDSSGRSALHIACARSHHGIVELLLRHNSNVASLCNSGQTPMDVVGVQALGLREWRDYPPRITPRGGPRLDQWYSRTGPQMYGPKRLHPSTLNSAETSTVDQIYDMLQAASAWRRRGWVVLMRSRPLAKVVEQLTRSGAKGISLSVQGTYFVSKPWSNTAGVIGQEGGVVQTLHDGGKARDDWSAAVVWVLHGPDDNLFRKIVRFL